LAPNSMTLDAKMGF